MIFFTSDSHYGHTNILKYCNRPFSSCEEMNKIMIDNWNSVVTPEDIVYHLGDFGMGSPQYLRNIFIQLDGQKILIKGSHDKSPILYLGWEKIYDVKLLDFVSIDWDKQPSIFLSHYAHRSWPKSFHGSWHLFGHSHGRLPPYGKSFDVGVDCNNFTPISLEQVKERMDTLENSND